MPFIRVTVQLIAPQCRRKGASSAMSEISPIFRHHPTRVILLTSCGLRFHPCMYLPRSRKNMDNMQKSSRYVLILVGPEDLMATMTSTIEELILEDSSVFFYNISTYAFTENKKKFGIKEIRPMSQDSS